MILIDTIYINNGGGKVLLDYLINEIEKTNLEVFYLFDKRIKSSYSLHKKKDNVKYLDSSLFNRFKFYVENRGKFQKVLCLGNVPPTLRMKCPVFVYFHNSLLLGVPDEFSLSEKLKFYLKSFFIKTLKSNSDLWFVQTNFIKSKLQEKYSIEHDKVALMPIFPKIEVDKFESHLFREKYTYLYVSNAQSNKNHKRLIEAFCLFYDKNKFGKLILTVSKHYHSVVKVISNKQSLGYPIVNYGFLERHKLYQLYHSTDFLIFPSLSESFGLGIIEAIESGCKVIGSDLPYMHAICKPSITFNPFSVKSIFDAFEESISKDPISPSISYTRDSIQDLIKILKK